MTTARSTQTATIPISGTASDNVTVPSNATLLGFITPSGMDGTALTFKVAVASDATPIVLKPNNVAYSVTIDATGGYFPVDKEHFEGVSYIQIVSNATETAEREVTLVFGRTT